MWKLICEKLIFVCWSQKLLESTIDQMESSGFWWIIFQKISVISKVAIFFFLNFKNFFQNFKTFFKILNFFKILKFKIFVSKICKNIISFKIVARFKVCVTRDRLLYHWGVSPLSLKQQIVTYRRSGRARALTMAEQNRHLAPVLLPRGSLSHKVNIAQVTGEFIYINILLGLYLFI